MTDEDFEGHLTDAKVLEASLPASAISTEIIIGEDAIYKQISFTYERPHH